jgi:hypothetical protein
MPQRPQSVRLTLRLDVATEPISGLLEDDRGHAYDFTGLLELVSALDIARTVRHRSPQANAEPPDTPREGPDKGSP